MKAIELCRKGSGRGGRMSRQILFRIIKVTESENKKYLPRLHFQQRDADKNISLLVLSSSAKPIL